MRQIYFSNVKKNIFCTLFLISFFTNNSQTLIITSPVATASYCAGSVINISYSVSPGTFSAANVFSVQISDNTGSFAGAPSTIGVLTSSVNGTIPSTLPSTLLTSGLYRFRMVSSAPPTFGSDNGADQTIVSLNINTPTVTGATFCQSETLTVTYSLPSCNFVNTPSANVFSVQLSNALGNFSSPVVIGTLTTISGGAIVCTIPPGTSPGTGYRVRLVSSSPAVISPDNGTNITVVAVTGNPAVFGNGRWNVYCYNSRNDFTTNYSGFYTEALLSFNTTNRWATNASPSSVATATGASSPYVGCSIPVGNCSFSSKRTNIPCGHYQIDINAHRQEVYLIINGSTVFTHTVGGDAHTAVYSGMIVPTDEIEIRCATLSGTGNLQVTFTRLSQINMSPPVTICAGTSGTLSATNAFTNVAVNYAWTPTNTASPPTGSTTVNVTPTVNTTYTVFATEPVSGCITASNTVLVTVALLPSPAIAISSPTICSGFNSTNLTATGAITYTWSPPTGLNTTTGNIVIASPTVNTTYTVSASNNCAIRTATRLVAVRLPASTPSPTAFGNNVWNVFCYNSVNFTNLFGFYAETNLSFNTTNRWSATTFPSNATASGPDAAYNGCILANLNQSNVYRRTGFACGYYRIDLSHDDNFTAFVNGVQVFQHLSVNDAHTGIWTGFLGNSSTVEFRHANSIGTTNSLTVTFVNVPIPSLSPPVTICAGSTATFTAAQIAGLTYVWSPTVNISPTTGTVIVSSSSVSTNYTCTVTDLSTGCSAATTVSLTLNGLPTTSVTPTTSTINCVSQNYTLSAGGANTYSWSPAAGLSATTGHSVIASPAVTTVYTVTGNNNCASLTATANVNVLALVNPSVVPTGVWNAYAYNTTVITPTNYFGYYTENGTGASGYDFNTALRWPSSSSPSAAVTSTLGAGYLGCVLPTDNWNLVFRRQGFTCNTYTIFALNNDKQVTILINGTQVASRSASSSSAALWVGSLAPTTTVEIRLSQTTGLTASLNVRFVPQTSAGSPITWGGTVSTDWFNASNWCGGSLPTLSDHVIIHNSGPFFQPVIAGPGANCADLTIVGARAAVTNSTSAIPNASLSILGPNLLTISGNWNGFGTFNAGTGTVSMVGTGAKQVNCSAPETFFGLSLNNTGNITFSSGTHRIAGNLDFNSGIVIQNGVLQFLTGATATDAHNNSYVDGPVVKFGNQAFTFPLGKGGLYRPIGISAPALVSDNFTAQYFNSDAHPLYTFSLTDVSIHRVSRCEYWILNRTGGSSIARVIMSWDINSCGVGDINDLLVARWDAGQVKWKDHGNSLTTGNTTSGTMSSSSPISLFSPFTLGTKSSSNILPISLIDFSADCAEGQVSLNWSTATEKNNLYFTIERSIDGADWLEVKRIYTEGNSYTKKTYSITDDVFTDSTFYYRLTQVDRDGTKETFKIVSATCEPQSDSFRFYPNPAKQEVYLFFNVSEDHPDAVITVIDQLGRTCLVKKHELKKGGNAFTLPLNLEPGVYYISFSSYKFKGSVKKLVIE